MTTKRKAELQRKLALAPVPKPPADLADRIKSDIPRRLPLETEKERFRLRQSVAFNIRVAASIILLVSSVYIALHLLSRKFGAEPEMNVARAKEPAVATGTAAPPVILPSTPPSAESMQARKNEVQEKKQIIVAEARRESPATRTTADEETMGRAAGAAAGALAETANAPTPTLAEHQPATADSMDSVRPAAPAPAAKTMAIAAMSFDVEATAAPFDAAKQIVRVSIDGSRATPDVAFNDDTVASWHTLVSDGTSLYEITLRPQTGMNDVIATVRVGGTERVIRRRDLRSWNDASRRMKYAALDAALDAGVPPKDVAAKARAAGLDDLAAAAEARARKQP